jgi:UDP-glucose:(heptosyl)LPS alpha-1,3-glucosyltransferase
MGHSRYVAELAARFKHDHEVHVFCNSFEEPDPAGLTFHHVRCWRPNALGSILSFVIPGSLIPRDGFDIIHAQGLCGLRHNVVTAHMILPAWHGGLERSAGKLNWKQRLAAMTVTPLERRAMVGPGVRRVIAVSERVRDDLAKFYKRTNGVSVIYHGVDVDNFHPRNREVHRPSVLQELSLDGTDFLALFVGNLQKGASAAIQAVARVPGIKLALVSSSDASAEISLAERLGVGERVRFVPFSKQVQRYFAAADAFIFPTVYDPFGLVITEAMASGLPTITSRAAGAAELIQHNESGWLTDDPWDIDMIAAGLGRLFADQEYRLRMSKAARLAVETYTWDRTAEETLAVYQEVVAERQRMGSVLDKGE